MPNNYFTIREVARYLNNNISGYTIEEVYTQEKNKLLFELLNSVNKDSKMLEFSIEKDHNYLILKDNFSKAKKNYVNLFEDIYAKNIISATVINEDRAIALKLEDETEIVFTFFSNKANCFAVNNSIIVSSFKDKTDFIQKNISDIISLKKKETGNTANETDIKLKDLISRNYKVYGKMYSDEALFRSKLTAEDVLDESKREILSKQFDEIDSELNNPEYILYSDGIKIIISLIKLKHLRNYEAKKFTDINDLVSEYLRLRFKTEKISSIKLSKTHELKQKISNLQKKINSINIQIEHCEDSASLKEYGNAILENLDMIKRADKVFHYQRRDGDKVEIKLKESLTPVENAQNYFEKYKKQKLSADILKSKITKLQMEKNNLDNELKKIDSLTDFKALLKEEKKSGDNKNDETSKFRKFKLKDNYEVWVGKDSVSNDLLTTKHSAPNDLWFHVRGASGSHTVLKVSNKKENIPKEAIHAAAGIAAYYSKARNSSSVPVAYCEKKFVKKKKGFKSGTVIMEREKVIFVRPALPVDNAISN